MNLKDEIRKLVELQKIDSQIYALSREIDVNVPSQIDELKQKIETDRQSINSFEESKKTLFLKKKGKEGDLAVKEEAISKANGQLYQLKTNKEYQAKLSEIKSLKADKAVLEEEILVLMDEVDNAGAVFEKEEQRIQEEDKKCNEEIARIQKDVQEKEVQVKILRDKRGISLKDIEAQILKQYESLVKTRGGLAIVPIVNDCCFACNIRVTSQTINEVKMYTNLVICHNCVRILYIPEDIE